MEKKTRNWRFQNKKIRCWRLRKVEIGKQKTETQSVKRKTPTVETYIRGLEGYTHGEGTRNRGEAETHTWFVYTMVYTRGRLSSRERVRKTCIYAHTGKKIKEQTNGGR